MRTRVEVAYELKVAGEAPDPDDLSAYLGDVLEALMDSDGIVDPEVNATLAVRTVEISLVVEAEDELAAAEIGISAVRGAIRAAGSPIQWTAAAGRAKVSTEPFALSA